MKISIEKSNNVIKNYTFDEISKRPGLYAPIMSKKVALYDRILVSDDGVIIYVHTFSNSWGKADRGLFGNYKFVESNDKVVFSS